MRNTGNEKHENKMVVVVQRKYHDYSSYDTQADQEGELHQQQKQSKRCKKRAIFFPLKLHDMLDKAVTDNYEHIVSWQPHGRSFLIHKPKEFEKIVLPLCNYKLTKLSSFQRQLNLYGFERISIGRDRGGYYHERFLKNKHGLANKIERIQVKGTRVRGRSNPSQEPNLWSMPWCDDDDDDDDNCDESSSSQYNAITADNCISSNKKNDNVIGNCNGNSSFSGANIDIDELEMGMDTSTVVVPAIVHSKNDIDIITNKDSSSRSTSTSLPHNLFPFPNKITSLPVERSDRPMKQEDGIATCAMNYQNTTSNMMMSDDKFSNEVLPISPYSSPNALLTDDIISCCDDLFTEFMEQEYSFYASGVCPIPLSDLEDMEGFHCGYNNDTTTGIRNHYDEYTAADNYHSKILTNNSQPIDNDAMDEEDAAYSHCRYQQQQQQQLDERHLLKEESKLFKSERKEEEVKMAIKMNYGHLQKDFHYQQQLIQSKNYQTECTGTPRPSDISS
ncbi:MAG: hypothetical protein ACI90V_010180 [Bacillariaceae sp.]|jgi:hypothetical protein